MTATRNTLKPDKILHLMTEQHNFIRLALSDVRVLWMGKDGGYKLYVNGVAQAFELTELSAREVGDAMDEAVKL